MSIDTDRFKEELVARRERLTATIQHHEHASTTMTEEVGELVASSIYENHLADTASETYERELDEGLEEDAREQLREVEDALARIEAGTYGICAVCGKKIPLERLEAVPWTTLCIDDARKLAR